MLTSNPNVTGAAPRQGAASGRYAFIFHRTCIRHYSPRCQGGNRRTALARITGISPLRGSLRAAPIACGCGWAGVSLSDCRRGSMRNSPPQAVLWTDGYRSAPFLAVFDAGICTGGPGASSSVASALSQGPLVSRRIPLPDMQFSKNRREMQITDTPSTEQIGPGCCS